MRNVADLNKETLGKRPIKKKNVQGVAVGTDSQKAGKRQKRVQLLKTKQ